MKLAIRIWFYSKSEGIKSVLKQTGVHQITLSMSMEIEAATK